MVLCKQCGLWPLAADDVYCAWCGSELMGYTVELDHDVLFLGSSHTTVQLTIVNRGQHPLEVRDITADQQWIEVPQLGVGDQLLPPDGLPLELRVGVQHALLSARQSHTAHISVTANDGKEPKCVALHVMPAPQLRVDIGECEIVLDDDPTPPRHSGRVVLETGFVQIETLQAKVPWVTLVGVEGYTWPCALGARHPREMPFAVVIDKQRLRKSLEKPPPLAMDRPSLENVQLEVICQEPEQSFEGTFTVACHWPPELYMRGLQGGMLRWKLFLGKRHTVTVTVENRGEAIWKSGL